ncbi:helix-turn-helix transcriptional regulator [Vagococcus sp. BWB3-3]|uniref:Helix-turn-helix transcriptional regulator n=1 Tax=Vagococcus allomyrinae TaxID=2794353 RepID=A0A940P8N4_9ENTE|nr:AraC family transcriptional regulator [Vagococcus allomyrinae]MBP1039573.1 helix-turn-helix transcriptional regulator [Vagococcus allomyrinae]
MSKVFYETHFFSDPSFPIIFHYNTLLNDSFEIFPHWHLNIEMLYIMEGTASITSNGEKIIAKVGDIVVINSNHLHSIQSLTPVCSYYCLIIDHEHSQSLGFDTTNNRFSNITIDKEIKNIFNLIINEMLNRKNYYKKASVALCTTMLILLFRNLWLSQNTEINDSNSKTSIVKQSISYINEHYRERIQINDICATIGISKFHFCRIFKEVTQKTVNEYLMSLRIHQARFLLIEKNASVAEAAEATGFNSDSYFSKCYKKVLGVLPSKERSI